MYICKNNKIKIQYINCHPELVEGKELFQLYVSIFYFLKKKIKGFPLLSGLKNHVYEKIFNTRSISICDCFMF